MKTDNTKVDVNVSQLKLGVTKIKVRGLTSYLSTKMQMSLVEAIEKKRTGKVNPEKDTRPEIEKVEEKIHRTAKGEVGIPATAFYKGMIEVAPYMDMDKKRVTGSVKFMEEIIPIKFSKQTIHKSAVKPFGSKSPLLCIRPEFHDWSCTLVIKYNTATITLEQIYNLINLAGFQMGVGAWRPQTKGSHGQYEIDKGV